MFSLTTLGSTTPTNCAKRSMRRSTSLTSIKRLKHLIRLQLRKPLRQTWPLLRVRRRRRKHRLFELLQSATRHSSSSFKFHGPAQLFTNLVVFSGCFTRLSLDSDALMICRLSTMAAARWPSSGYWFLPLFIPCRELRWALYHR